MKEVDLPAVELLLVSCPDAAQWSPAFLLRDFPQTNCALIAETQGKISGFAGLRMVAGEAELLNLAVAPEQRRRGVGRELLAAVLESAREAGARKIFLEVRASNLGAQALYISMGFASEGRRSNYYNNPSEDGLVLSKDLS